MIEKSINYYRGAEKNLVDIDTLKNEVAKLLKMDNLNFLIGAGCSSHIGKQDDEWIECGIPGMASLYKKFFEEHKDFNIAEKQVKDVFDGNLEKMLEYMGAVSVVNPVCLVDKDIDKKITLVKQFIQKQIISGVSSEVVLNFYREFYIKIAGKGRKHPVNVFTTNYDLYNEKALDSLSFPYNNGFVGTYRRTFNPASYRYAYVEDMQLSKDTWERVPNFYNLYKLHGSISWIKEKDEILEKNYETIESDDLVMIYPTPLKDRSTLMTPYSDLFRSMENSLLLSNSVFITLGYSFSDDHINRLILNSLAVPTFRLIVFGKSKAIERLIELNDSRIIVVNSDDKIHYFNNFVEKVMPIQSEEMTDRMRMQSVLQMIKSFEE